ncbi:TetR/AcrR family transcriptional regulator, partial [Leucobacter soli]
MVEGDVSRTLALAWGLAAAPQRGPKRELTLERIVEAAIEIADAEGLGAVTMQRVAQRFEFSTMALYRYVATKDELHRLMLDTALAGASDDGDPGDWQEGLGGFLRELVAGYRRHPWTLDIPLASDIHLMPGQIAAADRGLRSMRELAVPAEMKLGVLMLLSAFARGHGEIEREVLAGMIIGPETRALLAEAVVPARFPDVGPLIANGVYLQDGADASASSEDDAEQILGFAIEVLVSGLTQAFAQADDPAGEAAPPVPPSDAEAARP